MCDSTRRSTSLPQPLLGGLSPERFLERHWQKQPLLARGAFPTAAAAVCRKSLLALACDPRAISRRVDAPQGGAGWRARRGPFHPDDHEENADAPWTVLVQEADRHIPALASLRDRFRFLPNWRTDDVMISYATDGGGVGPHVDRHDVFLIQASGRRRWRISESQTADGPLLPGSEIPVLAHFEHDRDWLVEPGDLIYLPPGRAHEGVADGPCITISVGFRTPDPRELCAGYLRQLAPSAFERIRLTDPDRAPTTQPGEIDATSRLRLRQSVQQLFFERAEIDVWVGKFLTRSLRGEPQHGGRLSSLDDLRQQLGDGAMLVRWAPAHFAWFCDDSGAVQLFVGGEHYPLGDEDQEAAELLCGETPLQGAAAAALLRNPSMLAIVADSVLRGYLVLIGAA